MAVELAGLEATGCVRTVADLRRPAGSRDNLRIILAGQARPPPGSPELEAALADLAAMEQPPVVGQWQGRTRASIVTDYLERMSYPGPAG